MNALPFLVGLQFYLVGIIMILFGITGLITDSKISKISSLLILIMGVLAFILAFNSLVNPIYAAILLGVSLIIQGIRTFIAE